MIHHSICDLPGLLLQIVLAVHTVVDHQPTCPYCFRPYIRNTKTTLMSTSITTAYHILLEENSNKSDISQIRIPNVLELPGLLLQVVLAVHSAIDHQLNTCTLCFQAFWKYTKLSCQLPSPQHIRSKLKKIPTVSHLPGLLLLVVLTIYSAVDHQTTWVRYRQVRYPRKGLSMNIKVLQSSSLWVG